MRTFIITAFIFLLSLQGMGQIKRIDKFSHQLLYFTKLTNEDFFNQSEYIFEGKVLSTKSYWKGRLITKDYNPFSLFTTIKVNDYDTILISSLIKVTNVLKGSEIKVSDTIEMLQRTPKIYKKCGEHLKNLYKIAVYFACSSNGGITNQKAIEPLLNRKYAALYYSGSPKEYNFKLYGLKDLYFKTKADFYEYALQFDGITVPKIKREIPHENYYVHQARFTDFMNKQYALVEKAKANKKRMRIKTNRNLTLSIKNQKISSDENKNYIEFDMYAQANSNDTYYSNAITRITFNPLIFGVNLASYGKITLTKGKAFDKETYTVNTYDVSPTVVNIGLNESDSLSSRNRTKLSPTPQILFHVKIEMLSNAEDGYLNIAFTQMDFTDDFSCYSLSADGDTENLIPYNKTTFIHPPDFFSKNAHKNYSNPALDSFMRTQYLLREKAIENQKRMKENKR